MTETVTSRQLMDTINDCVHQLTHMGYSVSIAYTMKPMPVSVFDELVTPLETGSWRVRCQCAFANTIEVSVHAG